jgi:hypothetical protein
MEAGQDITELQEQLKQARLEEQSAKEVRELAEIASSRLQLKERADKEVIKANTQREAIKALLQARNEVVTPLRKAVDKALKLPALQDKCYEQYHDMVMAGGAVRGLDGQLPGDFTVPMLELADGTNQAYDKTREALYYLRAAHGLLVGLHITEQKLPATKAPDPYD